MLANPATLSGTSPLLYRFVGFSGRPTSHLCHKPEILSNTSRITSVRPYAVSSSCFNPPNHHHESVFRHFLGFDRFCELADSGGGSGGLGGSGDGYYCGGGSGAADGGRGDGWSFISWYLSLLAKYPVLTKARDLMGQLGIDQVSSLHVKRTFLFTLLGLVLVGPILLFWPCIVFLGSDVFSVVFLVALAYVIGIAVCCCLPFIIAILYAVAHQEEASKEEIDQLTKFKFQRNSENEKLVCDAQGPLGGIMKECGTESPIERALLEEDAECCICLSFYEDGVELRELPWGHHFHCACVDKWLYVNATCPLCKYNISKSSSQDREDF